MTIMACTLSQYMWHNQSFIYNGQSECIDHTASQKNLQYNSSMLSTSTTEQQKCFSVVSIHQLAAAHPIARG
jgi:hypothetical protein